MTDIDLPDQPDGIEYDTSDLPDPVLAAERVNEYIAANGDGMYDVIDGHPLYARDLYALTKAADKFAEAELNYQTVWDSRERDREVIQAMQRRADRNSLRGLLWRKPWRSSTRPNLRSVRDLLQWLRVAHDCADPAVGCSCNGGFRFPRPAEDQKREVAAR